MGDEKSDGLFGAIEAVLAVVGALTVLGLLAIVASVLAWEWELRKSERETRQAEPAEEPA
ncbi:MAG TPA: hypothetical protein VFA01_06295 [Candidatus Dormibacteraeota bacterium]|jgi:hypothetical protein|nr:hypothetical protein [Candidatus Dormibacteraeota bacterium]